MNRIPHEIDRLMWATAESSDPRAIEEFGERYPAYKSELVARIKLVRSLRAARPTTDTPVFRPSSESVQHGWNRGWALAAGAVALASIAFASVSVWNSNHRQRPVSIERIDTELPTKSRNTDPVRSSGTMHVVPKTPQENSETPTQNPVVTPLERPVTIARSQAHLTQVLQEAASQARIKLEFAPGFEDQVVDARYDGLPFSQVMADLGQNFGFTAMPQGEDSVLIVPALDPSKPPVTVPYGSYSLPSDDKTSLESKENSGKFIHVPSNEQH